MGHASLGGIFASVRNVQVAIHSPVHECLVSDTLSETGMGTIIFSRRMPDMQIAMSGFMLDNYCLGVKDSFFKILSPKEYDDLKVKAPFEFERIHPTCAIKMVEGSVAFARKYNFRPHSDYKMAKLIFGDFDSDVCPESFAYGKDGRPFYIQGPYDTPQMVERMLKKTARSQVGAGLGFLVPVDEQEETHTLVAGGYESIIVYEISDEPLKLNGLERLSKEENDELALLKEDVVRGSAGAIPILMKYMEKYPDIPVFYNYLYTAYQIRREDGLALNLLKETIDKFPDYLFGKISLASYCIQTGATEKVPEILGNNYDLSFHLNGRTKVHVSEFLNFFSMLALYFIAIDERQRALVYHKMLKEVDASHSTVKVVERKLFPRLGMVSRLIQKLTRA